MVCTISLAVAKIHPQNLFRERSIYQYMEHLRLTYESIK
jgi:hypothetical protein